MAARAAGRSRLAAPAASVPPSSGGGARPSFGARPPTRASAGPAARKAALRRLPALRSASGGRDGNGGRAGIDRGEPEAAPARDLARRLPRPLSRGAPHDEGRVLRDGGRAGADGRMRRTPPRVRLRAGEHDPLRAQVDARRPELEQLAQQVAGRRVPVVTMRGVAASANEPKAPLVAPAPADVPPGADLRTRALADANVQALLEIIPAEITKVEEL